MLSSPQFVREGECEDRDEGQCERIDVDAHEGEREGFMQSVTT